MWATRHLKYSSPVPDEASAEYFAHLAQAEINVAIKIQQAKIEMKAFFNLPCVKAVNPGVKTSDPRRCRGMFNNQQSQQI